MVLPVKLKNKVEKCLNPKEGHKKGLQKVKPSLEDASKHLDKARENLNAMKINYDNEVYDWSIVIGYYAMYHATLAALNLIGLEARGHDCATAALNFFFVKQGKLEKQNLKVFEKAEKLSNSLIEDLDKAASERVKVQYGVVKVKSEDADWMLKSPVEFTEKIEDIYMEAKGIEVK